MGGGPSGTYGYTANGFMDYALQFDANGNGDMSKDELQKMAETLYSEYEKLDEESKNCIKSVRDKNTEIDELTLKSDTLEKENERLEGERKTLNTTLTNKESECRIRIDGKDNEITDLKNTIEKKEGEINTLEADKDKLNKDLTAANASAADWESKYNNANGALVNKQAEFDAYKALMEECSKKRAAAGRAFGHLEEVGPIKKMLFFSRELNFYVYLVENFNEKWRNDEYGKYIWNIALLYKNGWALCIFSAMPITLSPTDRGDVLYALDWDGLVGSVIYSRDFESHEIKRVIFNGVTARKYVVKFWKGGHGQWETDNKARDLMARHEDSGDHPFMETGEYGEEDCGQELCPSFTTGHRDINQTASMWYWMKEMVRTGKVKPEVEANYDKHWRPPYTITEEPEEGKTKEVTFDMYRKRGLRPNGYWPGTRTLEILGDGIAQDGVRIHDRWGFATANDYLCALEAPLILRLEIKDLVDCNRVFESFCSDNNKCATIVRSIVIILLVVLAVVLLYMIFFKKCDNRPIAIPLDNPVTDEYTYIPDQ